MNTIRKYDLTPPAYGDVTNVELPRGARILHVGAQGAAICLWAIVNPNAPLETRSFLIARTGDALEEHTVTDYPHGGGTAIAEMQVAGGVYIDSVHMPAHGGLVFHVFETTTVVIGG